MPPTTTTFQQSSAKPRYNSNVISNVPSLVCAFSASVTTGGAVYAFGIYGDAMKKSLGLTQIELDTVSAALFVAGLLSWLPGLLVDRVGTKRSMLLGGSTGAVFSMLFWALCRQFIVLPQEQAYIVPTLCALAVAICLSCALIIGSMFKITVTCSGQHRGEAVGVAKGFVGLGAGVYSCIYQSLRTPSPLDFLPVTAFCFILCVALPAGLLLPPHRPTAGATDASGGGQDVVVMKFDATPWHFRTMYGCLVAVGLVVALSSITELWIDEQRNMVLSRDDDFDDDDDDDDSVDNMIKILEPRAYGRIILILCIWLGPILSLLILPRKDQALSNNNTAGVSDSFHTTSPSSTQMDSNLLIPLRNAVASNDTNENSALIHQDSSGYQTMASSDDGDNGNENNNNVKNIPEDTGGVKPPQDLNLAQMLQTPSAWLMLWTTTILVGSGTYKTNNMGEMVESLGFSSAVTPATLALFSVAQAFARVVTGVVSERTLVSKQHVSSSKGATFAMGGFAVSRPFYLLVASCLACVVHVILATSSTSQTVFVLACTVSGFAFGMAWPLMVLIVGDVFGVKHHGSNYLFFDGATKAIGTLLLSSLVAGNVYEAHSSISKNDDDKVVGDWSSCYGTDCFGITHWIVAALALTAVGASWGLMYTSRKAYYPA